MNIRAWKDQCDAVRMRIANEKQNLVTLIKTRANEIMEKEGVENFIGLEGCEWVLGMDTHDEHLVAWGDGIHSDLADLTVDELSDMVQSLYWENYETFKY
jgi:hypothetical protein